MKRCGDECIPCCDFCIHVMHGDLNIDGTDGPIACMLHPDEHHQELAEWCAYCDDFHCFRAEESEI